MTRIVACYLGADVPGRVVEAIAPAQREVRRAVKAAGGATQPAGKRGLHVRLADLGYVPTEALEAAQLAATRVALAHPAFDLLTGPVELRPSDDAAGGTLHLSLTDKTGALAALADALATDLERYGFERVARPAGFTVELAKISGCDVGALELDPLTTAPSRLSVRAIVLFTTGLRKTRRPTSDHRYRPWPATDVASDQADQHHRPWWSVALGQPDAPGLLADAPATDDEILRTLNDRLEARTRAQRRYDRSTPPDTTGVPR